MAHFFFIFSKKGLYSGFETLHDFLCNKKHIFGDFLFPPHYAIFGWTEVGIFQKESKGSKTLCNKNRRIQHTPSPRNIGCGKLGLFSRRRKIEFINLHITSKGLEELFECYMRTKIFHLGQWGDEQPPKGAQTGSKRTTIGMRKKCILYILKFNIL